MNLRNIIKLKSLPQDRKKSRKFKLPGSALIFTMFILSGMLIVAMSGAYIILTGIIAGGVQSQSTRAYFAAEAGAEKILWELRTQGIRYDANMQGSSEPITSGAIPDGTIYEIYHTRDRENPGLINNYTSVGTFNNISRSVEISF